MFETPLTVVDIETTGPDENKHGIVQIGAVFMSKNLEIIRTYESKCNPGDVEVDPRAMETYRTCPTEIAKCRKVEEILAVFTEMAPEGSLFCSWGPYFDRNFLAKAYKKAGIKWPFGYQVYDIKSAAHTALALRGRVMEYGGLSNYLSILGIPWQGKAHDALDDAKNTAQILRTIGGLDG